LFLRVGAAASVSELAAIQGEDTNTINTVAQKDIDPETESAPVTKVEFSFEHLNYDLVIASPELRTNLVHQVRATIAQELNVPPEQLDLEIRRGSVIFTIKIRQPSSESARSAASALTLEPRRYCRQYSKESWQFLIF